jgi:hypothetical protein
MSILNSLIYLDILFFSLLISFFYQYKSNIKFILFSFLVLFLIFIFSIRFDVGPDYYNYVLHFKDVYYDSSNKYNIYFNYISKIFGDSAEGYIGVFFVYLAISILLIFSELRRKHILLLGGFVFFSFGVLFDMLDRIKQFLSIAIFIFAFDDLIKRNFFKYLYKIMFAIIIHPSSIIYILLYFISKIRINKFIMLFFIIILFFLYITGVTKELVIDLYSLVPYYGDFYANNPKYLQFAELGTGIVFFGKVIIIIILLFSRINYEYKITLWLGIMLLIFGSGNLNIERVSDYFLSIFIIAFPLAYYNSTKKIKFFIYVPIISFLMAMYIKDTTRPHFMYKTIFSEDFKLQKFDPRND